MKLINVITKRFKEVTDYMDVNEDDNRVLYVMVSNDDDNCEPDYSFSQYSNGEVVVKSINGEVLFKGEEKEAKTFIKVLA